jgi:hypothetical protein
LYVNKLADIDLKKLERLITESFKAFESSTVTNCSFSQNLHSLLCGFF